MSERTSNLAEVVQIDKHRRLAYNVKLVNALVRQGLWTMNPYEFAVLMYLVTHTIFVGKDRITLPLRMMLEGEVDARGNWLQVPIPMSKRTLMKSIQGLANAGLLEVVRNRRVPGHGVVKAASTIIVRTDALQRLLEEYEVSDAGALQYNDAGIYPVIPDTEQSN